MHPAVETILSRMKSHPGEFSNHSSKWITLLEDYRTHFTEEEDQAIEDGLRELRMTELQERVFKTLTDDTLDQTIEDNASYGHPPFNKRRIRMHSGGPSQMLTSQQLQEVTSQQLQEVKLELEKLRSEINT